MEKEFQKRLKNALELRGKKAIQLADGCNISRGLISQYLSGKRYPKQESIFKIAKYLDVNPFWLMGFTDNVSFQSRQLSPVNACKAVGIEPDEKDVMKQTLLDDITAIASRQDLETLKTMYGVIKTLAKK